MALPAASDPATVDVLHGAYKRLRAEVGKVIVGQEDVVEGLVVALLARGHVLLVGVPGLAKTLLIKTLAQAIDLEFSRIQFTPDLMPGDITGTEMLQELLTEIDDRFVIMASGDCLTVRFDASGLPPVRPG